MKPTTPENETIKFAIIYYEINYFLQTKWEAVIVEIEGIFKCTQLSIRNS